MNIVDKIKRRIHLYRGKHLILSRVACLGHDVRDLLYSDKHLVNQQKVRVDMFLEWAKNDKPRPEAHAMQHHLERKDIFDLIQQQQTLPWLHTKRSSGLILMDSFAELTDQKFVHKKNGWSFACNYTDLNHTVEFSNEYECHGLMDIGDIEQHYLSFFKFINKSYRNKEIIFLHFPTALDKRAKFHERGLAIKDAIKQVGKVCKNVRGIEVEDQYVLPHPDDDFPYHYGKQTYQHFAQNITGKVNA